MHVKRFIAPVCVCARACVCVCVCVLKGTCTDRIMNIHTCQLLRENQTLCHRAVLISEADTLEMKGGSWDIKTESTHE